MGKVAWHYLYYYTQQMCYSQDIYLHPMTAWNQHLFGSFQNIGVVRSLLIQDRRETTMGSKLWKWISSCRDFNEVVVSIAAATNKIKICCASFFVNVRRNESGRIRPMLSTASCRAATIESPKFKSRFQSAFLVGLKTLHYSHILIISLHLTVCSTL